MPMPVCNQTNITTTRFFYKHHLYKHHRLRFGSLLRAVFYIIVILKEINVQKGSTDPQ